MCYFIHRILMYMYFTFIISIIVEEINNEYFFDGRLNSPPVNAVPFILAATIIHKLPVRYWDLQYLTRAL